MCVCVHVCTHVEGYLVIYWYAHCRGVCTQFVMCVQDSQHQGFYEECFPVQRDIPGSLQLHTYLPHRQKNKEGSVKWTSGHSQWLLSAQMGVDIFVTQIPFEH